MNKTIKEQKKCPKIRISILGLGLLLSLSACQKPQSKTEQTQLPREITVTTADDEKDSKKEASPSPTSKPSANGTAETSEASQMTESPVAAKSAVQSQVFKVNFEQSEIKDFRALGSARDLNQVGVDIEISEDFNQGYELRLSHFRQNGAELISETLSKDLLVQNGELQRLHYVLNLNTQKLVPRIVQVDLVKDGAVKKTRQITIYPDLFVAGESSLVEVTGENGGSLQFRNIYLRSGSVLKTDAQVFDIKVENLLVEGAATLQSSSLEESNSIVSGKKSAPMFVGQVVISGRYAEGNLHLESRGYNALNGRDAAQVTETRTFENLPNAAMPGVHGIYLSLNLWQTHADCGANGIPLNGNRPHHEWMTQQSGHHNHFYLNDGSSGTPQVADFEKFYDCIAREKVLPAAKAFTGPAGKNGESGADGSSAGSFKFVFEKANLTLSMPVNEGGQGGTGGKASLGQIGPELRPNLSLTYESDRKIIPSEKMMTSIYKVLPGGRGPKGADGISGKNGKNGSKGRFCIQMLNKEEKCGQ